MNICIGVGFDDIILGMRPDKVISKLGEPDKINETEYEGDTIYYYNDQMIKYSFSKDESNKLMSITCYNNECKLYGNYIIGKKKSDIIELLKNNNISKFEYDYYDTFDIVYCEEINTYFEVIFDKIVNIEIGVLYHKDKDEIIWPLLINEKDNDI